jgi:fatty acid desaturase
MHALDALSRDERKRLLRLAHSGDRILAPNDASIVRALVEESFARTARDRRKVVRMTLFILIFNVACVVAFALVNLGLSFWWFVPSSVASILVAYLLLVLFPRQQRAFENTARANGWRGQTHGTDTV